MRRFIAVAVITTGAVLALAGCTSLPKGVDGHLVDDWSSLPAAQQTLPIAGDCYMSSFDQMLDNLPVDCADSHAIEVAYVGAFTGSTAARVSPPPDTSALMKSTYTACQKPANAYLGGDWHTGLVIVNVMIPDTLGWDGGARWYACTVSRVAEVGDSEGSIATTSLKGALAHSSAISIKCVRWTEKKDTMTNTKRASCSSWFNGELAGFYTAPNESWPSTQKKRDTIAQDGCEGVVAHFLGFSGKTFQSNYVGWVSWSFDQDRWSIGDRTVLCYTWHYNGDHRFTGSAKGIRSGKPKG